MVLYRSLALAARTNASGLEAPAVVVAKRAFVSAATLRQQQQGHHDEEDSIQARMLKKLQERYQPPSKPPGQQQKLGASDKSGRAQPQPSAASISTEQAAEAVSQVVEESLSSAEATGAAEAALLADEDQSTNTPGPSSPSSRPTPQTKPLEPSKLGQYEEGRFLPKTPDNQPWAAVYVRPSHAGSMVGDAAVPSVYYGKLLKAGVGGSMKSASQRLKDLGVNPASLPLDDAKAMRAVREGIRRFERAGRVFSAKSGAWDYKSKKLSAEEIAELEKEIEAEAARSQSEETVEVAEDSEGARTTLRRTGPGSSQDSGRAPGSGSGMSVRRWTSVADERIEAARSSGFFKENKLRGKPLQASIHERNPYLGYEERLMNRIIKQQGASPPWVELNNTFHTHLAGFRSKLIDSYTRRAVRGLTQSGALVSGGGPGTGTSGGTAEDRRAYFTSLAKTYSDPEWQMLEQGYHDATVADLNTTLRRHNNLAPPSARKPMVSREQELRKCYEDSVMTIAEGLEDAWEEVTGRKPRSPNSMFGGGISNSYDIWGRPIEDGPSAQSSGSSWSFSSLFSGSKDDPAALNKSSPGGGDEDSGTVKSPYSAEEDKRDTSDIPYLGEGLIRKVRQLLGRSDSTDARK
ncbi:unnamed protein product [Jaminaea pallidilutea]